MTTHLRLPLVVAADGEFATVPEDSLEEIRQNVGVVLATRPGERLATPDLGVADPTFAGLDTAAALDVVAVWEPRADITVVGDELLGRVQYIEAGVARRTDG